MSFKSNCKARQEVVLGADRFKKLNAINLLKLLASANIDSLLQEVYFSLSSHQIITSTNDL